MNDNEHPIKQTIEAFHHSLRDSELSARICIPVVLTVLKKQGEEAIAKLDALLKAEEEQPESIATGTLEFDRTLRRVQRLARSRPYERLEQSLFVGLFAVYDAFVGDLLRTILQKRPELLKRLGSSISSSEVIASDSLESLKARILNQIVDDIRRKSYTDQFVALESLFDLQLRKFESWKLFVESSQRRHLFTHCGGRVSLHYLENCGEVGLKFDSSIKVGDVLPIGMKYFSETCQIVAEVGIKLAHTLWRKTFPEELEIADEALSDMIFELLKSEKWTLAQCLAEFAKAQKRIASKPREKIYVVNYCISLKFGGREEESRKVLEIEDWSDVAMDFRLAKAVLLDQNEEACELMRRIGKKGEYVSEAAYHTWPLFRAFRAQDDFRNAYREIYGYDFLLEMKREARKSKEEAEQILKESKPDS